MTELEFSEEKKKMHPGLQMSNLHSHHTLYALPFANFSGVGGAEHSNNTNSPQRYFDSQENCLFCMIVNLAETSETAPTPLGP